MMASFPAAEDRETPAGGASAMHLPGIRHPRSNARVRLFNVRFSPNLGDGLLAECLERALVECGAGQDTWSVDLAARTGYAPGSTSRPAQLRLLDALPPPLRRLSVRLPLALRSRLTWRPHYRRALEGADCAVIGGGNLLADLDLNFPTKIAIAVDEAARRGIPAFIYACGVDGTWSRPARCLLDRALRKGTIRRVFVRDERSRQAWNELAGTACDLEATLVRDPGLLAAVRYGIVHQSRPGEAPVIGINVTCPIALRYHAGPDAVPESLDSWYLSLACALAGRGTQVVLFTNGSPEDRAYLRWLHPTFAALAGRVTFPDPRTPEELVHVIAGLDGLAAFRMHAVIAAYSCGVPFMALAWDPKLEAFVKSVDRAGWLCHPATTPPDRAAVRLLAAMREGIPDDERERVIRQARRGVAMLQDEIARSLHR
jgi:polysaccharide pyruvyl transferase WcaK-like protein